jgi:hypothetical protein
MSNDQKLSPPDAWHLDAITRAMAAFQENTTLVSKSKDPVGHNLYVGLLNMTRAIARLQHKIDLISVKVK